MRTKLTLLAAALMAVGATSVVAQSNVYSLNVVGYVNVSVPANKFVMIENPLNNAAGGNILSNTITGTLPDNVLLYKFANGAFQDAEQYIAGFGWYPGNSVIAPGEGFFLVSPSATTITFTGEVLQGSQTNPLPAGFNIRGSQVPQSLPLGGPDSAPSAVTLSFPAHDNDLIYTWNVAQQKYNDAIQYIGGYGWFDPNGVVGVDGPAPAVGEAFFVSKSVAGNWVRTFTVN